MRTKLAISAMGKLLSGAAIVGAMLFWPAGSWDFAGGWLFMAVLFIPISILGIVMLFRAPELLRKRLANKEKEGTQRWVVALSGLMFVASFVVAGLNYRYGWHTLPQWVVWMAVAVFLLSYLMYAEVMRENAYLSRTVEVQEGQKVVDRGLYGVVRHPMYTATILLFLSMPLILGSLISFAIMLLYIPLIALRIRNEEQLLERELEGYIAYKQRVRYKVIPYIW
jgi:protein-S-isoprenylcysteine O-methyltransferase Ste14